MTNYNVAVVQALRTLAFGSIGSSYTAVGSAYSVPLRLFRIVNDTDKDMYFSLDGSTDHFYVPTATFVAYDLTANKGQNDEYMLQGYSQFYVKYNAAPGSGAVFIEAMS